MGIFDFLKKTKEKEITTLKLQDLKEWVNEKRKSDEKQEKDFIALVYNDLSLLINNLEAQSIILEKINLADKREPEKIKYIILDNLRNYNVLLKKLVSFLGSINETSIERLLTRIDSLFLEFDKRSKEHYEKATVLVGELGTVKELINKFVSNLKKNYENKKELVERLKNCHNINKKIIELEVLESQEKEFKDIIGLNILKINDLLKTKENFNQEIKKIKISPEYIIETNNLNKLNISELEVENLVSDLRDMFDFKHLSSLLHKDPKKMKIINNYNSNFKEEFKKDSGSSIFELSADISNFDAINEKISEINNKKLILDNEKKSFIMVNSNKVKAIEDEIKKIIFDLDYLKEENIKENKKIEKFKNNKEDIIKEIEALLIKEDVQLIM